MKSMLLVAGMGWVLGWISKAVVAWWKGEKNKIAPEVAHMMKWLEEKLHINIPDGLETWFVDLVQTGVNAADAYVSDPAFIRNVLRAVINKDASKFASAKDALSKVDWAGNIMAQLPDDLKGIVNAAKEDKAVQLIQANMSQVMPSEKIPVESQLRELVKTTVQANKINKEVVPVTENLLKKLIEESQARQEQLSK